MTDFDYWKRQYAETWDQSAEREKAIAAFLSDQTGTKVVQVGLGAGDTSFISGSASQHGHGKGDADLKVDGTDIYLEVTGPLVKFVTRDKPLWVRPDKLESARRQNEHETWVIHHLPKDDLIRVIPLNDEFWTALDNDEFPIANPVIRGARETYHEIGASHPCVKSYDVLIARLSELGK